MRLTRRLHFFAFAWLCFAMAFSVAMLWYGVVSAVCFAIAFAQTNLTLSALQTFVGLFCHDFSAN